MVKKSRKQTDQIFKGIKMGNEKYIIEIGEEGSIGLDKLDYCFNSTTQEFLTRSGLKPRMSVLDIGCGSGAMTCWIANQVGNDGSVVAIENNENQLKAAQKRAKNLGLNNIEFKLLSAYDIDTLDQQFNLVYCRFVLHHLNEPSRVIKKIFQQLKPNGIYAAEEGIVDFAFSYPYIAAWGTESMGAYPCWIDNEEKNIRDGNLGIKLFNKMHKAGFKIISAKIIHPLLTTHDEKSLLLLGREELKQYELEQGKTEKEWVNQGIELEKMVKDDGQIAAFYASCQVAGIVL